MMIRPIFPIPVGFNVLCRELTKIEKDFLCNQKTYDNVGNTTSENFYILNDEKLKDLKSFVHESVLDYFKEVYSPDKLVVPYITQSWVNYTKPGQYHHKHSHTNSIISGVFYIDADNEVDKIHLYKNTSSNQITVTTKNWNIYNSESHYYNVKSNDLIMFPSNLQHMVETTNNKKTRISLAFNVFLKGYLGDDKSLAGLHLGEK
jgi:uncharacterized protein (TIGR02466 family)